MLATSEVGVAAARLNLVIEIGGSYNRTLTLRDSGGDLVDLTGCSAAMGIVDSDGESPTELLSLTSGNGRLVLGGTAGTVQIVLSDSDVRLLEDYTGGVYDLFVRFSASVVWPVLRGTVTLIPARTSAVP